MNKEHHIAALIDQYLNGKLEGKALRDFEAQLASDPALKEEVALQELVNDSVINHGVFSWKEVIQQERAQLKKQQRKNYKLIFGSISTILLGILIGYMVTKDVEQPLQKQDTPEDKVSPPIFSKAPVEDGEIEQQKREINPKPSQEAQKPVAQKSSPDSVSLKEKATITPQETEDSIPNITPKKQAPLPSTTTSPCENLEILAFFDTFKTCEGKAEGKTIVTEVYGGTPPYLFQLENITSWQSEKTFDQLPEGTYQLVIKDKNNCKTAIQEKVSIHAKNCYTPEKGFNPDYETWEYRGNWNNRVKVTIRNKAGMIILEKDVNDIFVWDGLDNQGQRVPSGLYLYTIDIPQQKQVAGTVSVIY